jgi:hypothetical protein
MWFRGRVSVKLLKSGRIRIDYFDHSHLRVVTITDLRPITVIDVGRCPQRTVVPVASSRLFRIVVPFPLVSRRRNGERTDGLAQTLTYDVP